MEKSSSMARSLASQVFPCEDRNPLANSQWKVGTQTLKATFIFSYHSQPLKPLWLTRAARSSFKKFTVLLLGHVECLRPEIAQFNIRTLILESGDLRTPITSSTKLRLGQCTIPNYAEFYKGMMVVLAATDGKQPGNPNKGAEMIVDVVKGDGRAKGKEWPIRLPMGCDALELIRGKCYETLKVCDDWQDMITSTDY